MTKNLYQYLQFSSFIDFYKWSADSQYNNIFSGSIYPKMQLADLLKRKKEVVIVKDDMLYKRIKIRQYGLGVLLRDEIMGSKIGTKRQFLASKGQLVVSRIDVRNGSFGIVPEYLDGAIVTNDFWLFDVKEADSNFLLLLLSSDYFKDYWQSKSNGTTNRQRVDEADFLSSEIALPSIDKQKKIIAQYNQSIKEAKQFEKEAKVLEDSIHRILFEELGIEETIDSVNENNGKILSTTMFAKINQWGIDKISARSPYIFKKYAPVSLEKNSKLYSNIYRGKSPKYSQSSEVTILNQKCNRWNKIDLQYAKTVDADWLAKLNRDIFTRRGDILINSTGEGTLGRASGISNQNEIGLFFDSHMLLLRLDPKYVNYMFFVFIFNSEFGQFQINSLKGAQATKQTELGVENVKKIIFPLPPLIIQTKLVNKIQDVNYSIESYRQKANNLYEKAKKEFERSVFGEIN